MRLNGFHIFKAGVFITRGNWSRARMFANYFKKDFKRLPFNKKSVIKKIDEIIDSYKGRKKIGQKEALKILAAEDLEKVKRNIRKIEFKNPEDELNENFAKFKTILNKVGIEYNRPLFIIDSFPKPFDFFDRIGVTGTNFDEGDNKAFGLKVGIYLKKQALNPIISTFLLAHELTHNVIGLTDYLQLARGLEEGFTQLFGEVYLGSRVFGFEFAKNYKINSRLFYPFGSQQWELYYDWLRQGCVLYQKVGLKGMIEIIKKGRITLRKVDEFMLKGESSKIKIKTGGWKKDFDRLTDIILSFNRNMVYSPLSVYMARYIKKGKKIDRVIEDANVKRQEGLKALRELNERIFSVTTHKGKIAIDDTKLYIRSNNLRYEIKYDY